ncbi:purine and other phosphorylase-like protein, family 1 [Dyella jejuensis]|uniref:Purine and other phosphorylase-like protein, family 1 n=1 Tax=Dyella jejuensis TaxID=1432009 RepID=A0ABW8JLG5_9GAMM
MHATGIVVALASEAGALTAANSQPECITPLAEGAALCLSGMGPAAAHVAAHKLADAGATALAVFGVAGALHASLHNGALVCPERVLDDRGHAYATDAAWRGRLQRQLAVPSMPLHACGSLLSVDAPLLSAAAKAAAHDRHGALAVDMESAAVAAVAHERGLPLVVLRAIVDEIDDRIPEALNGSVDAWGRPRMAAVVAALCRHPSLLARLPRLYSRMQRATQALRAAAKATGPTLGWRR